MAAISSKCGCTGAAVWCSVVRVARALQRVRTRGFACLGGRAVVKLGVAVIARAPARGLGMVGARQLRVPFKLVPGHHAAKDKLAILQRVIPYWCTPNESANARYMVVSLNQAGVFAHWLSEATIGDHRRP